MNDKWWDEKGQHFYSYLGPDYKMEGRAGLDLLYRDVVDDGSKLKGAVDDLLAGIKKDPSSHAVEGQSHQAEVLYRYGMPDVAYTQMMDLTGTHRVRSEYPEVSYSVIGAMVTGLMGVTVDPVPPSQAVVESYFVDRIVKTLPGLGTVGWAELRNLPIRTNVVACGTKAGGSPFSPISQGRRWSGKPRLTAPTKPCWWTDGPPRPASRNCPWDARPPRSVRGRCRGHRDRGSSEIDGAQGAAAHSRAAAEPLAGITSWAG